MTSVPQLHVGRPLPLGPLALFPVWTETVELTDYIDATADNVLIDEVGEGVVSSLYATANAELPTLLVEGEILAGGMQDRALTTTVLLPPRERTAIPVACVEAGRWQDGPRARRAALHLPPAARSNVQRAVNRTRNAGCREADQAGVWSQVDHYRYRHRAAGNTGSIIDVDDVLDAGIALPRPMPGQLGVMAGFGDGAMALDLFATSKSLMDRWSSLLRSYLAEAAGSPTEQTASRHARRFARHIERLRLQPGPAVALGMELQATANSASVAALSWHGRFLHLAAFQSS